MQGPQCSKACGQAYESCRLLTSEGIWSMNSGIGNTVAIYTQIALPTIGGALPFLVQQTHCPGICALQGLVLIGHTALKVQDIR